MGGIMIVEKTIIARPVIIKKMSFKEAKEKILEEAIKTEDVELIGALTIILKNLERKING